MKKNFISVVLFCVVTLFNSCELVESIFPENNLSEEEKQLILSSIKTYSSLNDSILITDDPLEGFIQLEKKYINDPLIENVELNESGLFLKYKNGGVIFWLLPIEDDDPPYWKSGEISSFSSVLKAGLVGDNKVGNRKVAIINQQVNDESREKYIKYYDKTQEAFENQEFEVDRVNGSDVTMSFISNKLKDYGTIFFISHGGYSSDNTWINSGEEINSQDIEELILNRTDDWEEMGIAIGGNEEKRDGKSKAVNYYSFSEDYIEKSYKRNDFPKTLFYTTACQALKNTYRLAYAFVNAGCGLFVGWNETNSRGKHTGQVLFEYLLSGKTIGETFEQMPKRSKKQTLLIDLKSVTAELLFYPENNSNFHLVSEEVESKIHITSHTNNQNCDNRLQKIEGYVEGIDQIKSAMIELNGIPLELKIKENVYFSQTVVLQQGNNSLRIITKGIKDVNKISIQEKEIKLKGDFPPLDLFTELRWNSDNTDVDIHLLPPGSTVDDLFTSSDCFFWNKKTNWNAELDVDEKYGFGPEHITIPTFQPEGIYTLYIHYFANHNTNATPTSAYIDLTTLNNYGICIGPLHLNTPRYGIGSNDKGDLIKVCEIHFPSGDVTILNEIIPLLKSANINKSIPSK